MAINISNVTLGTTSTTVSSTTTASITPAANNLVLVSVASALSGTIQPNQPTLSGNSLTYVAVGSSYYGTTGGGRRYFTLFRALGASPTAGAITIDFAAQNQVQIMWSVDQASGIDTTGVNGANAIVQSAGTINAASTTDSVTLAAFSNVNNSTFGGFAANGNHISSFGTGYTSLANAGTDTDSLNVATEWRVDNQTVVPVTWAGAVPSAGQAVELKIAPAVASTQPSFKSLMGVGI
jgi:hypothetical protein